MKDEFPSGNVSNDKIFIEKGQAAFGAVCHGVGMGIKVDQSGDYCA